MFRMLNIPLLTELEVVDERHAIHISLLRSYQTASSYVVLTLSSTHVQFAIKYFWRASNVE
jgi:hypothetical protein